MTCKTIDLDDGRRVLRTAFGHEPGHLHILIDACPGCGVRRGRYHHHGCVIERCPACVNWHRRVDCPDHSFDPRVTPCAQAEGDRESAVADQTRARRVGSGAPPPASVETVHPHEGKSP